MMWFLLLLLCTAHNQPLIVQGEESTILLHGRNPCEGYIGIYHNSTLGYVGGANWIKKNDEVVCKSINCGVSNESLSMPVPGNIDKVWIDEVNCEGHESNLWECRFPGWAVIPHQINSLRRITCSRKINITLDGFSCAGAVQYSTDGGNEYSGYFCDDNWDKTAADLLCHTLKCGTSKEIVKQPWMGWKGFKEKSETMKIKCLGTAATHLWQCTQTLGKTTGTCTNPVSVICTDHERVQLKPDASNVCSGELQKEEDGVWNPVQNSKTNPDNWCKQMHCGSNSNHSQGDKGSNLTCSDDVKVVLMVNTKHTSCYGSVYVEVNGISQPVCASDWNDKAAKVVCSELKCGSVFSTSKKPSTPGIMDYVSCLGNEASLWHCRAKRDNNPFSCTSAAYVVCADSIGVRLIDGPGKCAGRLEIQHEDTWQRVDKGLSNIDSIGFVCGQLDCGKKGKSDEKQFSQGSGTFLAYTVECKNKATGISDCLKETNKPRGKEKAKAKAIICDEHKMVFLAESCSGMVGIAQGDQISWLSGSNTTWNKESANTVCQQMQCGNALNVTSMSNANMTKSIWQESYNCSSIKESLFNCKKFETLPSDHNDTIATVTCSGNISVDFLDKVCWGTVRVCLNNTCGGVCDDTWTVEKSKMLCKDLGCGEVLESTGKRKQSPVIFSSLHSTKETTNLSQCIFVRSNVNVKTCDPAYVVCSGSVKLRFNDPRDKCSGNVEVQYEDKWLPVCTSALEDNNIKTICEKLDCGKAGKNIAYFGPEAPQLSIIKIQCSANKSFGECTITRDQSSCKAGALQCSGWRKMALATDKAIDKACSGAAMVHSEGNKSAIAFEGWTITMGNKLCKDLECGPLKSYTTTTNFWLYSKTSFSCPDVGDPNIWECEKVSPSNESQSKPQLLIECKGEPNVNLTRDGSVTIDGIEVCDSNWKENDSHMVCRQNNGSKAIAETSHNKKPIPKKIYYHVSCEANHRKLGQCKRALGECKGKLVSVYCVGNAEFNFKGKCGGQIQVKYREKWEKVCLLTSFTDKHFKKLCQQLNCSNHKQMESKHNDTVSLETSLSCTADNQDIKHCLSHQSCEGKRPAEFYCGDPLPTPPPTATPTPSIWREMLGVGFALVLLILIVVFIRIYTVKNAKKSSNDLPGTLSRKEVEIESGSYDDVMSKSNEMEELNRGGLRSESEVVMENDAPSTSSCPYDDIDDPAAAQPLISRATAAGASGGDCIQNGATYEVDDQQENHEDIEASPEITWTEAEVHDSTQTTPESDAAAPLGSVQGD